MLFRKDIEKHCIWCQLSTDAGSGRLLCTKKGIVSPDCSCRKFSYDPLKRIPPEPRCPDFRKFDKNDFTL